MPDIDSKFYAATQVMDEARHVEVFAKYIYELLNGLYPINAHLNGCCSTTSSNDGSRWDMTLPRYAIMVEGLALAALGFLHADDDRASRSSSATSTS